MEFHCKTGRIDKVKWLGLLPSRKAGAGSFPNDYCGDPSEVEEINRCTRKYLHA